MSWQTNKQQTVAIFLCEAEYQSLAAAVQEATLLPSLVRNALRNVTGYHHWEKQSELHQAGNHPCFAQEVQTH